MYSNVQSPPSPEKDGRGLMKRLQRAGSTIPFFLFLLPLFILSHVENQYHHFIVYRFISHEIIWLLAAPPIALAFSFAILRSWRKAFMFALVLLLVFYFFGDLKDGLREVTGSSFISTYSFLLPLMVIVIVASFVLIRKSQSEFKKVFLFTNVLLTLFVASDWVGIALQSSVKNDLGDQTKAISRNYQPCSNCEKPDIFYIVFDEYSSSGILQKEFHYHNTIDSFLMDRGFRVIAHSRSNYNLTPFSIGSSFNLNYLTGLNVNKEFYLRDYLPGLPTVFKSEWVPILEKEGYEIVNHSIFNIEHYPPTVVPFDLWELSYLYGRYNIFRKIDYEIGWLLRAKLSLGYRANNYLADRNQHAEKVLANLLSTIHQVKPKQPEFVYAHFMLPHAPYCYDSSGRLLPVNKRPLTKEQDEAAYVNQLAYTNMIIKNVTNELFASRQRPFVVIIQGDHGYKQHDINKKQLEFGNMNAMYFYNRDYRLIYDSMSNVNTFRVVANTFFHQQFEMLKDTSFFLQYK